MSTTSLSICSAPRFLPLRSPVFVRCQPSNGLVFLRGLRSALVIPSTVTSDGPKGELTPLRAAFLVADLVAWPVVGGVAGTLKDCLVGVTSFSWTCWSCLWSSMSVNASSSANARSRRCFSVGKSRRGLTEARVNGRGRGEAEPSISVSSELRFG